ncbi:MAG TPA: DUF4129 domain-containing protein, partial [Actinomycetota bacterium]|nr:DUF4129 domain-containing protein [Actinomycetota bacterium]
RGGRTFGNGGFALPSPHRRDWSGPALVAALALFGLLAFGVPLGKAARRRAILARAGPRPSQRVLAAYRVMADGAADVGLGRRAAETIQEYRGRLTGTVRFTNGDFETLTALAGRAAYAEDGLSAADGRRAVTLARTASRDIRRSAGRPRLILGLYRLERPSFLRPSDG